MYNDNNNDRSPYEYHYRYLPDSSEPIPTLEHAYAEPPKPKRAGLKIFAGILCAALLLCAAFGAGWLAQGRLTGPSGKTQLQMVDRGLAEVKTVSVTGSQKLTFPEIYAANVNSCVSINVVTNMGYNIFGQSVSAPSSGSGFIATKDGYIITNYHVVEGGDSVSVTLNDGKSFPAQVIGGDKDYDIAVIKIEPGETELKPVTLGTSSSLQVGDDVVTIGNPLGELTFSMAEGIVSCLNREITLDGTPFNMIQISAAVNNGNSGGPLFNIYGEVVGIVSAKYSSNSSNVATIEGLGFAIPLDDVLLMIEDIMTNGQVTSHAYMGISVGDAARYPESGLRSGGYLAEVVSGGPADRAGLQAGDVITMIGTTTITASGDVTSVLGSKSYKAGDTATITYVRGGEVHTTELTFGSTTEKPAETSEPAQSQQSQQSQRPQQDNGGYSYGYGDMDDFFDQFFGGYGFGGRGAA